MEPIAGTSLCPGIAVGQAIVYEDAASLMKFIRLEADSERILVSRSFVPSEIAASFRIRIIGKAWDEEIPLLTRSEPVPAVGELGNLSERARDNDLIVVDGYRGMVYVNPDARVIARYQEEAERARRPQRFMLEVRHIPAQTQDGRQVALYTDASTLEEARMGAEQGADGVALLRQESLLTPDGLPLDASAQEECYRTVGTDYGGKFILVEGFNFQEEPLRRQMEALLRSGDSGVFRLALPLEWGSIRPSEARQIGAAALQRVQQDRFVVRPLEVGAHLSGPAQFEEATSLLEDADFLSIDADRLAEVLLSWKQKTYPLLSADIMEALADLAEYALITGKPLFLCGRLTLTGDLLPVLVGLGWSRFGIAPEKTSDMKTLVRSVSVPSCAELSRRILTAFSEEEIEIHLNEFLLSIGEEP